MEQRNGRAVRKGNTVKLWGNNTVDVVIYGTEKTLDAYKFNLLKTKQMFINQINNGTIAVRRIDEDAMDEDNGMNFAEFVALLSGNTDLLEKTKLDNKIMQLEKEQAIFKKDRIRAERKIAANREDMTKAESAAAPLRTMQTSFKVFEIVKAMAEQGNPNSVTDAGVGALAARSAVLGACLNVKINAAGLKDRAVADDLIGQANRIVADAEKAEREILEIVESKIK